MVSASHVVNGNAPERTIMEKVIHPPQFKVTAVKEKWIVRPEFRQNQDGLRIEAWMPYRGAIPTNLCRFFGLIYDDMGNIIYRLPLKAENIEGAFKLFPVEFEKWTAAVKANQEAATKAAKDKADAIARAAEKEVANGKRSEIATGHTPGQVQDAG